MSNFCEASKNKLIITLNFVTFEKVFLFLSILASLSYVVLDFLVLLILLFLLIFDFFFFRFWGVLQERSGIFLCRKDLSFYLLGICKKKFNVFGFFSCGRFCGFWIGKHKFLQLIWGLGSFSFLESDVKIWRNCFLEGDYDRIF